MRMVTQKHIAAAAGVSLKTVSRVINGDESVAADTRDIVKRHMHEMGYSPNIAAQLMRSKSSKIVGFIANGVATSFAAIDLVRGAQDMAWELGYRMMLVSTRGTPEEEAIAESELTQFRADATIYATVWHQEVRLQPARQRRILLNCFERNETSYSVVPDDYDLARQITSSILDGGHKDLLFLNLSEDHVAAKLRLDGFLDEGRTRGLDLSKHSRTAQVTVSPGTHRHRVKEELSSYLDQFPCPEVILCGQDLMAIPVYSELERRGIQVGVDVKVASFDNLTPVAESLIPGLSSVELPYYEMGRIAMQSACAKETPEAKVLRVKGSLVRRSSF